MNYLVVYADADLTRKIVDHWRGRTGAVVRQNSGANFGEFCGGYAWTDLGGHGAQGFGDDLAAGAEFFELFWSVNRHSTSSQQLGLDDGLILKTRPYTAISCSRNRRRNSLRRPKIRWTISRSRHCWSRLWN